MSAGSIPVGIGTFDIIIYMKTKATIAMMIEIEKYPANLNRIEFHDTTPMAKTVNATIVRLKLEFDQRYCP